MWVNQWLESTRQPAAQETCAETCGAVTWPQGQHSLLGIQQQPSPVYLALLRWKNPYSPASSLQPYNLMCNGMAIRTGFVLLPLLFVVTLRFSAAYQPQMWQLLYEITQWEGPVPTKLGLVITQLLCLIAQLLAQQQAARAGYRHWRDRKESGKASPDAFLQRKAQLTLINRRNSTLRLLDQMK